MRFTGMGQILFALSMAAIGALTLWFPGFAAEWPIVPHGLAAYSLTIRGIILLVAGLALFVPRTAAPAALVLAAYLLLKLLLVPLPNAAMHPLIEVNWEELGENMVELAGAWALFSMLAQGAVTRFAHARAAQILFGLALLPIGLSHFFYLDHTAELIPAWLPFHVPLAKFTGAAHFAAGVAILVGVLAPLAATLEAVMVSLFTLLVWVSIVATTPPTAGNLGEICASAAISGAAWAIAESLRERVGQFAANAQTLK